MLHRIKVPEYRHATFDLSKLLDGTQDFRWRPLPDGRHSGVLDGHIVHLRQRGDTLEYQAHTNLDTLLTSYFRLDEDIDAIYSDLSSGDPYIAYLTRTYPHLRVLRQPDPWECTVAYICSATNNVQQIKKKVEAIAVMLGEEVELNGNVRHKFPPPERILEVGPERLEDLRLGLNRHQKIVWAARRVIDNELDLQRLARFDTEYVDVKTELMNLNGVGEKISDCIALFSLDKLQAFPVDRNIKSAIMFRYGSSGAPKTPKALAKWAQRRFGEYAGWASQLLFQSWIKPVLSSDTSPL